MLFFFQAEDGIRDKLVTGVQTCALPIFSLPREAHASSAARISAMSRISSDGDGGTRSGSVAGGSGDVGCRGTPRRLGTRVADHRLERSEERRVGKESGTRRSHARRTEQ